MSRIAIVAFVLSSLALVGSGCDSGEANRNAGIDGERRSVASLSAARARVDDARDALAARAGEPRGEDRKEILFGDLHAHTTWSFDAFMFSLPLLGGEGAHPPNSACDFARHCAQIDFFALTDHAESLLPELWEASKESVRECNALAGDPANPDLVAFMGFEWSQAGDTPEDHYGHRCVVFPETDDASLPLRPIASADTRRNQMGLHRIVSSAKWIQPWTLGRHDAFLAFIEGNQALEDCPAGVDPRDLPKDCREVAPTPAELNASLDQQGIEALTIPHGTSWGVYTPATTTIDKHLARENYDADRMRLIEVMSGHGNSEEYRPYASKRVEPNGTPACEEPTENFLPCCWQAGEIMRARCGDLPEAECEERVALARKLAAEAWVNPTRVFPDAPAEAWLDCDQCRDCFRPSFSHRPKESVQYAMALGRQDDGDEAIERFRYGFIASSDGHTGRPGHGYKQLDPPMMSDTRAQPGFPYGAMTSVVAGGAKMDDPRQPQSIAGGRVGLSGNDLRVASFLYPGGLAAVHASSRSRDAIWDALQRREVYGTSGPRILLWFDLLNGPGGRQPMGSEAVLTEPPRFEVRAAGSFEQKPGCPEDSVSALPADRLDYLCHGECYHPSDVRRTIAAIEVVRIRPVAPGADPGSGIEDPWRTFACEPDREGCTVAFEDPDYAGAADALYYVRALEEPSMGLNGAPLETEFDADGNVVGTSPCTPERVSAGGCPSPVQERAWSSPIFIDAPEAVAEAATSDAEDA